mmetsp:Transcript_19097/g.34147  ORF Transcript_19097/g.34147 Transcript_19097/m.34147 type:complete len:529 (+) Transcript_19097:99-1685(+)|eukprot:CAMPEP_0197526146 /NCGR_PEP_ID=MMETSP1318-20131121/16426_1 /TAXON_ID=552666 /ORGANISM="Partenskyella glossopodia, Strain RCC365" /LENGTH=528 /DNA_ID=CAMNT_0043080165 /DNA_START=53 /DNA_END=1642 /DNA_ORIENTATION=+
MSDLKANQGEAEWRIRVKRTRKDDFWVKVVPDSQVDALMDSIKEAQGIPNAMQRIIWRGKIMRSGKLRELGLSDGCAVHLVTRRSPTPEDRSSRTSSFRPVCHNGHPMSISDYSEGGYVYGWMCERCGRGGFGHRWLCLQCRYDICHICEDPHGNGSPATPSVAQSQPRPRSQNSQQSNNAGNPGTRRSNPGSRRSSQRSRTPTSNSTRGQRVPRQVRRTVQVRAVPGPGGLPLPLPPGFPGAAVNLLLNSPEAKMFLNSPEAKMHHQNLDMLRQHLVQHQQQSQTNQARQGHWVRVPQANSDPHRLIEELSRFLAGAVRIDRKNQPISHDFHGIATLARELRHTLRNVSSGLERTAVRISDAQNRYNESKARNSSQMWRQSLPPMPRESEQLGAFLLQLAPNIHRMGALLSRRRQAARPGHNRSTNPAHRGARDRRRHRSGVNNVNNAGVNNPSSSQPVALPSTSSMLQFSPAGLAGLAFAAHRPEILGPQAPTRIYRNNSNNDNAACNTSGNNSNQQQQEQRRRRQ